MKAIRIAEYGPPEVMRFDDVPDPVPGPGEVVIAVEAVGVNPADHKFRSGMLAAVSNTVLPFTPGMDVVGTVTKVGEGVSSPRVGDRVLAMLWLMGNGGYAEQVALPAEWCAPLPDGLEMALAAALPTPATTAVEWIEDDLAAGTGNRILVTGATGAVGRIACYVAKRAGAQVTAAVRRAHVADVRYADDILVLGEALEPGAGGFDMIADTVGGATATGLLAVLRPGGILSTVATDPVGNPNNLDVTVRFFGNHCDADRLGELAQAVATGALEIGEPLVMKLSEAPRAHALIAAGGAGKIVLVPDGIA